MTYFVLLLSLKPTNDSRFNRMASIVIMSSAGSSMATNFSGYTQRPPSAVSTVKFASILFRQKRFKIKLELNLNYLKNPYLVPDTSFKKH